MSPVTGLPEQATAYVAANKIIKKMKKKSMSPVTGLPEQATACVAANKIKII